MPHAEITDASGNPIPSVTQVLSVISKRELYKWYGMNGWNHCEKIKREAGEWGTELHDSISQYLKNEKVDVSSRCYPMLEAFAEWKEEAKFEPQIVEPEQPYVSQLYNYQGTFDAIGTVDGELVVCDWKTSSRIYSEYGLQLAAYAWLYEENTKGTQINTGVIVRIDKKTNKIQEKRFERLDKYFEVFKHLLPVFDFDRKQGVWKS
jgi:hypothetical protein